MRLLPEDFEIPEQKTDVSRLNFAPPVILVSESPGRLRAIDKEPVRAPVEGISMQSRNTQGVRLIRLGDDDRLVGLDRIISLSEDEEDE